MKNIISSSSEVFLSSVPFSLSSMISCASDFGVSQFSTIKSTNLKRKLFFSSILKVTCVTISKPSIGTGDSLHSVRYTFASIFPPLSKKKQANQERSKSICPTVSGVRYSIDFLVKAMEKGSNLRATRSVSFLKLNASSFHVDFLYQPRKAISVVKDDSIFIAIIAINESLLQYASKTVLQCSGFIFFSHRCILSLLHSNIRISVPTMFGVNDQNKNGQQSCSNKSKCLSSPNISSVH